MRYFFYKPFSLVFFLPYREAYGKIPGKKPKTQGPKRHTKSEQKHHK